MCQDEAELGWGDDQDELDEVMLVLMLHQMEGVVRSAKVKRGLSVSMSEVVGEHHKRNHKVLVVRLSLNYSYVDRSMPISSSLPSHLLLIFMIPAELLNDDLMQRSRISKNVPEIIPNSKATTPQPQSRELEQKRQTTYNHTRSKLLGE